MSQLVDAQQPGRGEIVAFDVQPDGTVKNQRDFGKLEADRGGDGMTIDAAGRLDPA